MKKFLFAIISVFMLLSTTSCVTSVYAQDDEMYTYEEPVVRTNVDIEIVIINGTPFIIDGLVQYYLYNGLYYYPYYYNNYFYYRVYARPLIHYPRHWRPVPRGYWFRGDRFYKPNRYDRHHFDNVRRHDNHRPHVDRPKPNTRHNDNVRPRIENNRNRSFGTRPSSTRSTVQRPNPNINNRPNNINRGGTFSRPQGGSISRPSAPPRSSAPNRGGGHFGGRR